MTCKQETSYKSRKQNWKSNHRAHENFLSSNCSLIFQKERWLNVQIRKSQMYYLKTGLPVIFHSFTEDFKNLFNFQFSLYNLSLNLWNLPLLLTKFKSITHNDILYYFKCIIPIFHSIPERVNSRYWTFPAKQI